MSMREFERETYGSENDAGYLSKGSPEIPADFSVDDVVFAHELDALFNVEKEEIPPLFAQTLLGPHNPQFQVAGDEFESKIRARVFRRLHLHRRIFCPPLSLRQILPSLILPRRSIIAIVSVLLVIALSIVYTAPSFASGLSILLAGSHSGVMQVQGYPDAFSATAKSQQHNHGGDSQPLRTMSILDAQQLLHFPLYWPDPRSLPDNYVLDTIYLYNQGNQTWADGPLVELDYDYTSPGVTPHGSGRIAICEFKPTGKVLQVVQLGSARELKINSQGNASAIYVDGQWTALNDSTYAWNAGGRSELIYEKNGIVFWMVGSQSDGIDGTVLSNIASSLDNFDTTYAMRLGRVFDNVLQSQYSTPDSLAGDVIYLDNPNNPGGPTLIVVGEDSSAPSHLSSTQERLQNRLSP
jgi:hypothetical protein